MEYKCINYVGRVFIETPANEIVDISEPYLVYNKECYKEATEYFRKLGIQCVDAIYDERMTTLNIIVEGTVEIKSLYNIVENAKICEYDNNQLKIEIPL